MKKIFIGALATCVAFLVIIYSPMTISAHGNTGEMHGKYRIQRDAADSERIIGTDNRQVGYKMSEKKHNQVKQKKVRKIDSTEATKRANEFAEDILDIEKYTLTEKIYNKITDVYTLTYYYLINGIKTQDYCFVDVDSYGNIVSYAAPNIGSCDGLDLLGVSAETIKSRVYELLTDEQKSTLIEHEVSDLIITNEDGRVVVIAYVLLHYQDDTVIGGEYRVVL